MRNFKQPNQLAYLVAKMSKGYGIEVVYLRPRDVDITNGLVRGKTLKNDKWYNVKVPLPKTLDISPYCFTRRNRKIINYLRENAYLSDDRKKTINKQRLQEELGKDPDFKHMVILTLKVSKFRDVFSGIKKYSKVVLKPIVRERGKSIYIVHRRRMNRYVVGHNTEERVLSRRQLKQLYKDKLF